MTQHKAHMKQEQFPTVMSNQIKSNQINFINIAPFIHVKMQPKVLYIKRKENETNPLNIPTPHTLIHVTHTHTHTHP